MAKIAIITGVSGQDGSYLAELLVSKRYKVYGICNPKKKNSFENLKNIKKKIIIKKININDYSKIKNIIKRLKPTEFYHLAAQSFINYKFEDEFFKLNPNINGTHYILSAIKQFSPKTKFYFAASSELFGNVNKSPQNEDTKFNPRSAYGVSKVAAENILKILCKTHGLEYNIAVPHNIIGPKQKYDDPFRNVVSIMVNLMLQNRQPIIYGDGEQKRCFSDIDDCLYCLDKLITDKKIISQTVNIGPDEEFVSINKLFKIISNKLQFNQEPKYYLDRPNEVKDATCSSDFAREILNYKTTVGLEESIDKVIDYIKSNGTKEFKYNYSLEIDNSNTPITWKEKLF